MFRSIYESFSDLVQRFPNKDAVFFLGSSYSYSRLKELAERLSKGLYDIGVREGQSMVIYLPNSVQWVIAWLSAMRMGVIAVPISPIYVSRDLQYIVNDCGAETVLCQDTNFSYVKQVLGKSPIKRVIVTRITDLLPLFKRFFGWASNRVPTGKVSKENSIYYFPRLLKQKASIQVPAVSIDKDRMAEIIYTGGTTKHPKGVPITHGVYMYSAYEQSVGILEDVIPPEDIRTYASAPLFHTLAQGVALNNIIVGGGSFVLDPQLNLDAMFDNIKRLKVTGMLGVPALYRMILEHDRIEQYDLSSLKYCFCGGDVLPEHISNRWKAKFNVPLSEGYGTTEACGGVSMCCAGENAPPKSIGKRRPSKEIMIVDPNTLKSVSKGTPGELLVSSVEMVRAYWNKPEETASAFIEINGKLWYRTSDILSMDNNGYLYFIDRTVDMIRHKGYRISAAEIESVLQEHPAIISSAVVGIPDEKVGERIKAFVILKEDVKGITGYDLIKWCRSELPSYKVPHYIEFRDALPKSKVGKMLKREIRQQEKDMSQQ